MFFELLKNRWIPIFFILLSSLVASALGLASPYFQKEFVDLLTGHIGKFHFFDLTPTLALLFSFVCIVGHMAFHQMTFFLGFRESLKMQRELSQKIYEKIFSLNIETQSERPIGEMVSLYATDVPGATIVMDQSFPQAASTFIPLILAPYALSVIFGIPLWPLIVSILALTFISLALAYRQAFFFLRFKSLAAERIGFVNEWIQNIRTFKILGWLESYEGLIFKTRREETLNRVAMVSNGQTMNTLSSTFTFFLNLLALYLLIQTFKTQPLSPGEVLALFWIVGIFLTKPFRQMPWFFTFMFDSWTSYQRLQKFFKIENKKTQLNSVSAKSQSSQFSKIDGERSSPQQTSPPALEVRGLSLQIDGEWILEDLHFEIHQGQKVALVGEIGSGKTMTLLSLLGMTGAAAESIKVHGKDLFEMYSRGERDSFSFVSQEGFVLSADLGQNVTFDFESTEAWRSKIIECLQKAEFGQDLHLLPAGLATEIGERGVNLSGGQRQRINLARAIFHQRQILLCDDCFSALDVDTERKIVENLFKRELKNITVLLSTHRLSVLTEVDEILFMENGRILARGDFESLLETSPEFRKFTESLQVLQNPAEEGSQTT